MKHILFVLLLVASANAQVIQRWPPAWTFYSTAADPIPAYSDSLLWWEFANTNDPTEDSSAVGTNTGDINDGTANEPTWTDLSTSFSTYYDFDGGDYIVGTNESNFDFTLTDSFSLSTWVNIDSFGAAEVLITKARQRGGNNKSWKFWFQASGELSWGFYDDVPNFLYKAATGVTAGRWQHCVATYDGSDTTNGIGLYLNGSLLTPTAWGDSGVGAGVVNDEPVMVGAKAYGSEIEFLTGELDEPLIYDVELTPAQISTLYWDQRAAHGGMQWDTDNRSDWSNTVAVYCFEESGKLSSSPNGGTLSYPGGAANPTWSNDGGTNGWIYLDGADYAYIASDAFLSPGTNDMTIAMWLDPDDGVTASQDLYSDTDANSGRNAILAAIASGKPFFQIRDDDGDLINGTVADVSVLTGGWHHVVYTREGGVISGYVNGRYYTSLTNALCADAVNTAGGKDFTIGKLTGFSQNYYEGKIDDYRVYLTLLSSNEIYNLWNDTKGYH